MIAHSYTESHRVGDIHKAFAHPLCIRKHFNVAVLAGPLKCYPSNQINFLVFIALLLLAYIIELILSGHFLLLYFVLRDGTTKDGLWICVRVFPCCVMFFCVSQYLSLSIPLPLCVCMAHVCLYLHMCVCVCDICEMHYCQIASPLQCSLLRRLRNVITNHTWRASWHSHKVRMKYENDYGDLRLYYHDFLIIASLIYFCLLSLSLSFYLSFLSSNLLPMAHAEVEQKGKSAQQACPHSNVHTCSKSGVGCQFLMPALDAFCTSWQNDISFKVTAAILRQLDLSI